MAAQSVPANRRSIAQDKFTWSIPGSRKKISLRSAAYLTMNQTEALQKAGKSKNTDANALLLGLCYSAEDKATFKDLPYIHIRALLEAWQKDGKEALGK